MDRQSAAQTVSPGAKKAVVLAILAAAIVLFFALVFMKAGSNRTKIITEGDRAPEFSLSSVDGRTMRLSGLRGKVVMVHFWATWCPPCVEEMPTLDRLYRELAGKDFELLAVSVDESGASGIVPFLQRNRLSLPVFLDPDHAVAKSYGTFKFPETYILDRNGIVRYKVIGARDWNEPAVLQGLRELIAAR
jgi:peroxiredoxin